MYCTSCQMWIVDCQSSGMDDSISQLPGKATRILGSRLSQSGLSHGVLLELLTGYCIARSSKEHIKVFGTTSCAGTDRRCFSCTQKIKYAPQWREFSRHFLDADEELTEHRRTRLRCRCHPTQRGTETVRIAWFPNVQNQNLRTPNSDFQCKPSSFNIQIITTPPATESKATIVCTYEDSKGRSVLRYNFANCLWLHKGSFLACFRSIKAFSGSTSFDEARCMPPWLFYPARRVKRSSAGQTKLGYSLLRIIPLDLVSDLGIFKCFKHSQILQSSQNL